jgi:NAD(P)-dependent dehydrogenase (short-subunit alcohol dehydrogenase family)
VKDVKTVTSEEVVRVDKAERWALMLGASVGCGAAIARALAVVPGLNIFAIHRGHHPGEARVLEKELLASGRQVVMHVADAGTADGARACAEAYEAVAGRRSVAMLVHSIAGASLGHFLSARGDAFHPRQFQKTFDYLAHSFAYWAQILHERELLAPKARLLGLTNSLHDSLLHNTGLIAAAKAALEMYVRHLAMELGPLGHRVNLLKFGTVVTPALKTVLGPEAMERLEAAHREMIPAGRMCTLEEVARFVSVLARDDVEWFNGATIDFTGGMTLRLLDLVLRPN